MKKRIELFFIVRRSLRQHALSTLITTLSIALGTGLVMAVIGIKAQSVAAFTGGQIGFDAVLGARGSPLQFGAEHRLSSRNLARKYPVDDVSDDEKRLTC